MDNTALDVFFLIGVMIVIITFTHSLNQYIEEKRVSNGALFFMAVGMLMVLTATGVL